MALLEGDRIQGRYVVQRPLGAGGLGDVYLVRDEPRGTTLVLKQLRGSADELLSAFRSEFLLLSSVSHPHLSRVHDFGSWTLRGELLHYYTAEWVEGTTLEEHARRTANARCLEPLLDALAGLAALHELGVRHGDFTPWNVLVDQRGRGVLIDLSCARRFNDREPALAGTPGYVAPELLQSGLGDARSDLYAVGATLRQVHAWAGLQASGALSELIAGLTAADPARRPASALDVLATSARQRVRAHGLLGNSPVLVGREREVAQFFGWLAALAGRTPGPRVVSVCGPAGVGVTRLLRELSSRAQLRLNVLRAHGSEPNPVRWLLQTATGTATELHGAAGALDAANSLAERSDPLLLLLEDAHHLEAGELQLLMAFTRSLTETSPVGVLISGRTPWPGSQHLQITLGPIDRTALARWTGGTLSSGSLDALWDRTFGMPAAIQAELARASAARSGTELGSLPSARARVQLMDWTLDERQALALSIALGGDFEPARFELSFAAFERALSEGLLRRDGARLQLADPAELDTLRAALSADTRATAHRHVARSLLGNAGRGVSEAVREAEVIFHCAQAGDVQAAGARLLRSERLWQREPGAFASRLEALFNGTRDVRVCLAIAEVHLLMNEMPRALSAVARVLRQRERESSAQARLLAADALTRQGRAARAERVLSRLFDNAYSGELRARAYERTARACSQRGDYTSAEHAARAGLELAPTPPVELALREALGVAASYLGRAAEADACFAHVIAALELGGEARDRCRVLGHRAIAAFRSGRIAAALDDHARALEVAERHALDDLVCVGSLNLGTAQQQAGDLGAALACYERALGMARALGRENTEFTLRYNLANLHAEIGDMARARRELETIDRQASSALLESLAPALALLRAELAKADRTDAEAERELAQAARSFTSRGLTRELLETEILRAEWELAAGAPAGEGRALAAEAEARKLGVHDLLGRSLMLRARAQRKRGEVVALGTLEEALEMAVQSGQRLLEAKISTELAEAAAELAPERELELGLRARRLWDRLGAHLPEALRDVFWKQPQRARLALQAPSSSGWQTAEPTDAHALRRLLALSRRVNSSLSLDRVLDDAVDAAVELSSAERGFLLLTSAEGDPSIVARRESVSLGEPPSQSIVARVLTSEEPVLTLDAQSDERFLGQRSVHALRLKSVLCVPVSTPAGVLGALYVDTRAQRARFRESDRELLLALADHVAVALSNARLHAELSRHAAELSEQKRTIERLSRHKDRELEQLREQVDVHRRALALRYDYSQIVGRGERMRGVLMQLDRIIDSGVSVLVEGESGTGKELIARALHFNGERREQAFLGVNCAALPEALLESELFGHVRGAFTGADRDKKGLMPAAHGGTLFLDEIGEMSLATQAKLLRVLQEREVRPLGATRSLPLDVRLVCATHRNLLEDVSAGRFREDLYYRIAVMVVRVPPLRERQEDIPELGRSILARLAKDAGRAAPELSPDALRALAAHAFPGNVRELENVLTRAFVLSDAALLERHDLQMPRTPELVRHSRTRVEFEGQERNRILQALQATRWNVSIVARQLGIPRNTLYRKLARYGLQRAEGATPNGKPR